MSPERTRAGAASRPAGASRFAGLVGSGVLFSGLLVAAALVAAVTGTGLTGPDPVAGVGATPWPVGFGIPVFRVLLYAGGVAAAGVAVLPRLLGSVRLSRSAEVIGRSRSAGAVASGVWALAALGSVVLRTAELTPGPPGPVDVADYVAAVGAGRGLVLSAGCALVSMMLFLLPQRRGERRVPDEVLVAVVLFGLLPLPLTGHAAAGGWQTSAMIATELHVIAAASWSGGLAAVMLFVARDTALLAAALPRFSRLATWCVLVVATSGLLAGLVELASSPVTSLPGNLVGTRYGVLLLAKMACLAVVAGLALVVRTRLLPPIAAGRRTAVAVWAGWELVVMALAVGVAVVLSRVPVAPW